MTIRIDIVSDVVCPWCYIGKRHLEQALSQFRAECGEMPVLEINWLPFQLNPDLPPEGVARGTYLEHKFGGPDRAKEIYARVTQAGKTAGIDFDFDRIQIQPNTLDAHRLIHMAAPLGKQDRLVEALFRAYFLDGMDLTRTTHLASLAATVDIDADAAGAYLASDEDRMLIHQFDHQARTMGISGVPFFIFNQKHALSGAQPPAVILQALRQVHGRAEGQG